MNVDLYAIFGGLRCEFVESTQEGLYRGRFIFGGLKCEFAESKIEKKHGGLNVDLLINICWSKKICSEGLQQGFFEAVMKGFNLDLYNKPQCGFTETALEGLIADLSIREGLMIRWRDGRRIIESVLVAFMVDLQNMSRNISEYVCRALLERPES